MSLTRRRAERIRSTLSGVAFSGEPPTDAEIAELNLPPKAAAFIDTALPAILDAREQGHLGESRRLAQFAAGQVIDTIKGRPQEPDDDDLRDVNTMRASQSPLDSTGNVRLVSTGTEKQRGQKPCAFRQW